MGYIHSTYQTSALRGLVEKKVQCLYHDDQTPGIPDMVNTGLQHFISLHQEHFFPKSYKNETQNQKLNKSSQKSLHKLLSKDGVTATSVISVN